VRRRNPYVELGEVYLDEEPDRDERFWDHVDSDGWEGQAFNEVEIDPVALANSWAMDGSGTTLLDALRDFATDDQVAAVEDLRTRAQNVARECCVLVDLSAKQVIDGWHRIAAMALEGIRSARALDLGDERVQSNPPKIRVKILDRRREGFFVRAYVGRRVAGTIGVGRGLRYFDVIRSVVKKEFRRQGIGLAMYQAAHEEACRQGLPLRSQGYQRSPEATRVWERVPGARRVADGRNWDYLAECDDPQSNPPRAKAAMKRVRKAVGKRRQCYPAAEVVYHAGGGRRAGLTPVQQRHEGVSHWWVRGPEGEVLDPASAQFNRPVPYDKGRGRGFLTARPSRRARDLAKRSGVKLNPPYDPSRWQDVVEDPEWVRRTIGASRAVSEIERAIKVGAVPPLEFQGAGASASVFCDANGIAFKVGHTPLAGSTLDTEVAWLRAAKAHPDTAHLVPEVYGWFPDEVVIVRECVRGEGEGWRRPHMDWHAKLMSVPGWSLPESGDRQWVLTESGPVIIDGGYAHRRGEVLASHVDHLLDTEKVTRGKIGRYDERLSDLAWAVYTEKALGRLPAWRAGPLLARIRAAGDTSEWSEPK